MARLTLLGAAGEALGYDRYLKSNTTKRCTHSVLRQGCMLYELIPTIPEVQLLPLIERPDAVRSSVGATVRRATSPRRLIIVRRTMFAGSSIRLEWR
jgi:hypothetical protein